MNSWKNHKLVMLCLATLFIAFLAVSCTAARKAVNTDSDGTALKGYDAVAYFTMGKPVKGSVQFAHEWNGARWLFSNQEHLDLFAADPEKYAPQYGGY